LSGWSWLNGTTSVGRPASMACAVVPTPPWCTTAHARGMTSEYGAYGTVTIGAPAGACAAGGTPGTGFKA